MMSSDYYPMTHPRRGQFIIINNESFKTLPKRDGTKEDADALEKVFSALGFDVKVYEDQKDTEMSSLMTQAASYEDVEKKKGNECDCFGVAVLTHGEDHGVIYGKEGFITVDELVEPFKGCVGLAEKPKLFFIQACRGDQLDKGFLAPDGGKGTAGKPTHRIPIEADFLYAYSTPPGNFSWRSTKATPDHKAGSWFIQALCEQLREHCYDMELMRILTRVNHYVAYERESCCKEEFLDRKKSVPSIVTQLTRELKFPRVKQTRLD
jgi:hypothetical protein